MTITIQKNLTEHSGGDYVEIDNMASSEEISEDDFGFLKTEVSNWYDSHDSSISMFKVLFRDKIKTNILSGINTTMALLDELDRSDDLSTTDLTLLYNTIKITTHFGLKRRISKYIKSLPDVKEMPISEFSEHRQKIMKFGNVLTKDGVRQINGLYNTPLKKYTDSWSMITDLEEREIISEGDAMEKFIDSLEKLKLPRAMNALTEETIQHPRPNKPQSQDIIDKTKSKTLKRSETSKNATTSQSSKRSNTTVSRDEPKSKSRRVKSEPIPELSQEDFNQLIVRVSSWWRKFGSISKLKVILSEFKDIPVINIEKTNDPTALLKLLEGKGHIKPADITVLVEAAVLGGSRGVEEIIQKTIPTFPGLNKIVIRKIWKHRQNLIEFGNVIDEDNMKDICTLCGLDPQEDQWCLIFQLEKKRILTDDPKKKESFIEKLKDNGMIGAVEALNTF